jgi:hypothetical protein
MASTQTNTEQTNTEQIDFDEYMQTKKVVETNELYNEITTWEVLNNDPEAAAVSFIEQEHVEMFNVDLLRKNPETGAYYIEIKQSKRTDLISDFVFSSSCPAKFYCVIGNTAYYDLDKFITFICMYNDFRFRVEFAERPSPGDSFTIKYKSYYFKPPFRSELIRASVRTKHVNYHGGFTAPLDHEQNYARFLEGMKSKTYA